MTVNLSNINIPIFIITKDRVNVLQQSIESYYKYIKTPFEIVIHDNGTTFPETLKYLRKLESQGIKVYFNKLSFNSRLNLSDKNLELNSVKNSIKDYFKTKNSPYYIVTDPDIALDQVKENILEFYAHILDNNPRINVVGPMLRIDDIPDHYPLKNQVIRRQEKYWLNKIFIIKFKGIDYQYVYSKIDTTFGMYRRDFVFNRKCVGVRTFFPYQARHLDWYLDPENLTEDQIYYIKKADFATETISHWGGPSLRSYVRQ